jgi:hypothetical protein
MSHDFLDERKQALEEQFFAKRQQELVARFRQQKDEAEHLDGLKQASGITNTEVLTGLAAAGLSAETVAALSLVPLVEVAWADGSLHDKERDAVIAAANDVGIKIGSPAGEILEAWLSERPEASLLATWKDYVAELCANLGDEAKQSLRDDVLERAQRVAKAAGGLLGAAAISGKEQDMLFELERAFL